MEGTLKVDTSKLTSAATQFQSTGNTIRTITNQMTEIVNGLTGQVWTGDAATKYTSQFKGLQDDINKMLSMITEHVNDLNQMAKAYDDAEKNAQTSAAALQSDVIQ